MTSTRTRFGWLAAAALLGMAAYAGCYNPVIENGGLQCSAGGKCPSGFQCLDDNHCWKPGTGGAGGQGGSNMDGPGGTGGGGSGGSSDSGACMGPLPACTPDIMSGQPCDPVCQSGCDCDKKCNVTSGKATCMASVGSKAVMETCTPGGGPEDCGPGLICLRDDCGARCFRFCREGDDSACGAKSHCQLELTSGGTSTGYWVCDVPNNGCSPIGLMAKTSCMYEISGLGCYVIAPDESGCDCPATHPPKMEGDDCTYDRDCEPGLLCTVSTGGTKCRRVCDLMGSGAVCGSKTCKPYMGSKHFGICDT